MYTSNPYFMPNKTRFYPKKGTFPLPKRGRFSPKKGTKGTNTERIKNSSLTMQNAR